MATATKKPPAAAKSGKPATAKPAAKPAAAKSASKSAANAADKPASKSKSKKAEPPPPPPVYVSSFVVGNRVTHASFGEGKVTAVDRDQLTIQFGKDQKVILDGFVKPGPKG
jgi:hypothetical protein